MWYNNLVVRTCEVCGAEVEDAQAIDETVWNQALTMCADCEAMLNDCVVGKNQIQRGR